MCDVNSQASRPGGAVPAAPGQVWESPGPAVAAVLPRGRECELCGPPPRPTDSPYLREEFLKTRRSLLVPSPPEKPDVGLG